MDETGHTAMMALHGQRATQKNDLHLILRKGRLTTKRQPP
jgi:hypothetical protein